MRGSDWLGQAERLVRASSRRPRQIDLRGAIRCAYYAMFHTLCRLSANTIAGAGADRSDKAWADAYRTVDHGPAKHACAQVRSLGFPPGIIEFAALFRTLQEKRHDADYNPQVMFTRAEVVAQIQSAARAIERFRATPRSDLRAFLALVLKRQR